MHNTAPPECLTIRHAPGTIARTVVTRKMDKSLGNTRNLEVLGRSGINHLVNKQLKYNNDDFPREEEVLILYVLLLMVQRLRCV